MSLYRDSEESRPCTSAAVVLLEILDGRPWTARSIRNNHLRQHAHLLARNLRSDSSHKLRPDCRRLFKAIVEKTVLFTTIHPTEFQAIPALIRIAAYAKRWIRDPENWSPEPNQPPLEIFHSLLNHLFVKWPLPGFFHSAWFVKGDLICQERDWFCHLASGGSLRRTDGIPPSVTSRALHLMMKAPAHLTIRQALRWGQLTALNASEALLTVVLASRIVADLSNDAIWSRLFEKIVAAENFQPRHFGIIADTLLELTAKGHTHRPASLVDLPLADLLAHSRRYWRGLLKSLQENGHLLNRHNIHCPHLRQELRYLANTHWPSFLDSEPFRSIQNDNDPKCTWEITELTYHAELMAESRLMRHCVHGYRQQCESGRSAIFSLRKTHFINGKTLVENCVTIEVDQRSRRIVQVRGKWNRSYHPFQIPVLREWAAKFNLRV